MDLKQSMKYKLLIAMLPVALPIALAVASIAVACCIGLLDLQLCLKIMFAELVLQNFQ